MERLGEITNRLMEDLRKKREEADKKKKQTLAIKLGKNKKRQSKRSRHSVKQSTFF